MTNSSACFRLIFPTLLGASLCIETAYGQSLDSTVEKLAKSAATSYVGPIVSGFGADLNAGWFHRAPPPSIFNFGFEAGLVMMATSFKGAPSHFQTQGEFQFDKKQAADLVDPAYAEFEKDPRTLVLTPGQKQAIHDSLISAVTRTDFNVGISGATVIGKKDDSIRVAFAGQPVHIHIPAAGLEPARDTVINIPQKEIALGVGGILEKLPVLPLMAPQLTLGTVAGTQVTLRWLPQVQINSELGKFSYLGFGIQHNPGVWLPFHMPVDVSGGFFTQKLEIGKIFSAQSLAMGITTSKTLGFRLLNIIPYAGFMVEKSTMNVKYDYTLDLPTGPITRTIDFDLEGENKTRLTLGLSLRLLFFNLNTDFNLGKYKSLSAGLMIGV